jgi:hypothetical protein
VNRELIERLVTAIDESASDSEELTSQKDATPEVAQATPSDGLSKKVGEMLAAIDEFGDGLAQGSSHGDARVDSVNGREGVDSVGGDTADASDGSGGDPVEDDAAVDSGDDVDDPPSEEESEKDNVLRTLRKRPASDLKAPVLFENRNRKPTKRRFLDVVRSIYDFFQGDYSIQIILQVIHSCAGDYKAAVVKLTQGEIGTPILEMPIGTNNPSVLKRYLRG